MLIVEDGTGLATADSYISLAEARTYALSYGYTLPVDDTDADVALRKGAVYVGLFESSFSGERLVDTQSLAWPRENAFKCAGQDQIEIPSDSVPIEIQNANVIAAASYGQSINVRPNDDGLAVASKEVTGAVKVSYFDNGKTGKSAQITEAVDALGPLMCNSSLFSARTVRV
jgi:hypothetical protein